MIPTPDSPEETPAPEDFDDLLRAFDPVEGDASPPIGDEEAEDAAVQDALEFVDRMLAEAIAAHAQEIHLDPGPQCLRVRYRIDGICREAGQVAGRTARIVVTRVKILANLDIAERRRPQHGLLRFPTEASDATPMRVATLPVADQERVCITLAETNAPLRTLEQCDFSTVNLTTVRALFAARSGLILHAGPHRSGRTALIYAGLSARAAQGQVVLTAERVVERRLPDVHQVELAPALGLDARAVVDAIRQQSPEVVLIAELTHADLVIQACELALDGVLVFATMHTRDVGDTLVRLQDMGLPGPLRAHALAGVVAHRLIRRVCSCRRLRALAAGEAACFEPIGAAPPTVAEPVGCAACAGTGYRGRLGIHEVFAPTSRGDWAEDRPSEEWRRELRRLGVPSLQRDALEKARSGLTSLPEALRLDLNP